MDEKLLNTDPEKGLSSNEVNKRIALYGKNIVLKKKRFKPFFEFLQILLSPLIFLLIGASLISAAAGDKIDFFIILAIILVSGTVSYFQKSKAEHEAEKLKQKVSVQTTVLRDNAKKEIPIVDLVVGDIVFLSVGDLVPADCKILTSKSLSIDESTLTGESFPKDKNKNDIAFMGTNILSGEGVVVVDATGRQTRFAMLSKEIIKPKPPTAFDLGLKNISILIVKFVIVMSIVVFAANSILHGNILQSLLFALAIAVGITPEMLPIILTINLSKGAVRMEKKDVVIKYLPAIQNLGGMNILCTDKTGTITEGDIKLQGFENYKADQDTNIFDFCFLNSYFQSGFKNPLDGAILENKADFKLNLNEFKLVDEIPFDFERKRLSIVLSQKKKNILITKGSVIPVLEKCTSVLEKNKNVKLTENIRKKLLKRYQDLSKKGFRVIAIAKKNIAYKKTYEEKDESSLEFLGFIYFFDPIKKSVKETLKALEKNKIEIKILTGDNEFASRTICENAGLKVNNIINGSDFEKLTSVEKLKTALETTIFTRLTPEQKAEIINVLKNAGKTVGYLGDGINDAPPLKNADVGISVSNGADIALDIADVVLMQKSLHVLNAGVEEGRKTHINIFKYLMMEISSNFGNMITVSIASFLLPFIPMLPTQILLNNFLYDVSQFAIATDHVDSELLLEPKKWNINFIKKFMLLFGSISSIFDFITFFTLFYFLHFTIGSFRTGWFIESLLTQTLIIFSIRTARSPFIKSLPSKTLVFSSIIVILIGIFITFPPIGHYFSFSVMPAIFYPLLALITVCYFVIVEIVKGRFYRVNRL